MQNFALLKLKFFNHLSEILPQFNLAFYCIYKIQKFKDERSTLTKIQTLKWKQPERIKISSLSYNFKIYIIFKVIENK